MEYPVERGSFGYFFCLELFYFILFFKSRGWEEFELLFC